MLLHVVWMFQMFHMSFRLNLLHLRLISCIELIGQLEQVNEALLQACIQNQTEILLLQFAKLKSLDNLWRRHLVEKGALGTNLKGEYGVLILEYEVQHVHWQRPMVNVHSKFEFGFWT